MRRVFETLLGFAVLTGVVVGITTLTPAELPRVTTVEAVRSTKVVCVPATSGATVMVDNATTVTPLGGSATETKRTVLTGQETSVVAEGTEGPVGGAISGSGAVRTLTQCVKPVSQGVIALPATADTQLKIVNPDASEAAIDLTLYGAEGEIQALGARGITLAAYQERTIALSVLTEKATPVGVSFQASRGRAAVMAITQTQSSGTAAGPSQLGTSHLLPGIPAGATSSVVVLANPSETRITANLTAYGTTPAYQPQGGGNISIPPHASVSVSLENALLGEASAIQVNSDAPVMAGMAFTLGDSAQVAPVEAGTSLGTFTSPGGVLQLTNPGTADAQATVTATGAGGAEEEATVTVGAGQTVVHKLPATTEQGQRVTVGSGQPLFGAVVSSGETGSWAAPLEPMTAGGTPPLAAELDPELH